MSEAFSGRAAGIALNHGQSAPDGETSGTALWGKVMQSLQPGLAATTGEENIMNIFEVGRIVVKIAVRDAGKKAVVVEQFDNTYVLIDGATRRRKVNIRHLEPLDTVLELSAGAAHEEVERVLKGVSASLQFLEKVQLFFDSATLVRSNVKINDCEDSSDNMFLECAVSGGAEYILTDDGKLKKLDGYRGIKIKTVPDFYQVHSNI